MSEFTSPSDGLCDRCSRFLHFKGGEHGFYAETTDDDGTVHIDIYHTRDGKSICEAESRCLLVDDYPAMTELNRSISRGCGFCDLLLTEIQKEVPKVEKNMVLLILRGYIQHSLNSNDWDYNVCVSVHWMVTDTDSKTMDEGSQRWYKESFFRLLANQDTMAAKYLRLFHAPFHPSPLCSENITSIQNCLSKCSAEHVECARNRKPGHWKHHALPSRLLQIWKHQTEYRIRLVQVQPRTSSQLRTLHPKYAALSYCWGDQDFIKSTPENITDHYSTIPFSRLPPGFRDTIELCWEIGIFYLWIDSLCIIQGNQSDWDRESARMKDVYTNASLTIILASTSPPLEGLSNVNVPTTNSSDVRVSYRLDDDDGSEITYFIRPSPIGDDLSGGDRLQTLREVESNYEHSIHHTKWANRGWTFQESYLSTRKLFICSGHIAFSCRTSSCLQGILRICRPLRDLGPNVAISGPGNWYDLVGHYSSRKLSRSEDKLPAISAVASLVKEGNGDYVAGLWTKSLERGLLWAPNYQRRYLERQTTYRGPTWSWCAYDGCLAYRMIEDLHHLTREFDILDIRRTLAEPTAIYGRLSTADGDKAYLRIRAKVAWVTIEFVDSCFGRHPVLHGFDGAYMRGGPNLIDCGETDDFQGPQRVAAMLVARGTDSHFVDMGFGLFLRPIPSLGPVITYERVGSFGHTWHQLDMLNHITEDQELCLV